MVHSQQRDSQKTSQNADDLTAWVARSWEQFWTTRDAALREQLILHYAPLARWVVARLGMTGSATLDYQDLLSHGLSGLIEAVDRFDPRRGVAFEAYATQRIRGSVVDALRSMDHLSRSVRQRMGEIEQAMRELRTVDNVQPTDEQVAEHLHMTLESYHDVLEQANIAFLSLDSPLVPLGNVASDQGNDGASLADVLEDPSMGDLLEEIEERELRESLVDAIRTLNEREQLVLSLYYNEELTVREVAAVMEVSPSRVSQLLARAIMMLRAQMVYHVDLQAARAPTRASRSGQRAPRNSNAPGGAKASAARPSETERPVARHGA